MSRTGVTVIELMVALVVLTLLTTAVALSRPARRTDASVRAEALRACRARAVESRREVLDTARSILCLPDGDTIPIPVVLPFDTIAASAGRSYSKLSSRF